MIIVMHYQMICTKGVWRIRNNTTDEVGNHHLLPSMALKDADEVMQMFHNAPVQEGKTDERLHCNVAQCDLIITSSVINYVL